MSLVRLTKSNQLQRKYLSVLQIFNQYNRKMSNGTSGEGHDFKKDYSHFLNSIGAKRKPSLLRELFTIQQKSGTDAIFMAGGYPNGELFPFQSMNFQLDENTTLRLEGAKLTAALQYQATKGYPQLLETLRKMQLHYHNPPNFDKKDIIVTVGSQHGISTVIEMTINIGDPIIVPEPMYSTALTAMDPYSPVYLAVPTDSNGMQPEFLKSILDKWISSNSHEKRPKIMYLNPTGSNPSGMNTSTSRKKQIYRIAQEYDLLILEDDPYYFLHFEQENPTSFLSLDVDDRVIRFDSYSKIISSGLRVGFATGPSELIRRMELGLQCSVLQASSLSQVLVDGILREWDISGFDRHTQKVRELYRKRRDLMVLSAKKHLEGLAEWQVPKGGMFLWMKVLGVKDTYQMVMKHGVSAGIVLLPGKECIADRSAPCPYLRASFSVVSYENMDKGFARLANLIREEQKRQ